MSKVLIVDIGNTATELAVFEKEKMVDFIGFFKLPDEKKKLDESLKIYGKTNGFPEKGMIFSVAPSNEKLVRKSVKKFLGLNLSIFDWKSYELKNKNKKITEPIGGDLLADIKAAEKYYPGSSLIADCGTITKLIYLNTKSSFEGLSMFPGIETMIKMFHERTALLPNAEGMFKHSDKLGTNTIDSMNHGAYWSTVAGIENVYKNIKDKNTKLIITGGNLRFIKNEFPEAIFEPYLTLKGMYLLYKEVEK